MNEHAKIREWFALAAADALDDNENVEFREHLASCAECASEWQSWQALAGALRRLPTPQVRPEILQRAQIQLITHSVREVERRRTQRGFFWLLLFGWAMTFASWPVLRLASNAAANLLHVEFLHTWYGPAAFSLLSWIGAAAATAVLCLRHREERGLTYEHNS